MFLRIDDNYIVQELPGVPYDTKMRPRFHPDIMARIVWAPTGGEVGDIFDPVTATCRKPPAPAIDPIAVVEARKTQIELLYVQALLMRDQQLANNLETEYIGLLQTAPAVPGTTVEETAS